MIKIGVQGIEGSFAEIAAHHFARNQQYNDFSLSYLVHSEGVLSALSSNAVDYGIFAIENTQGGIVIESIEALAKYQCHILDRFHIPVNHSLLTLPQINLNQIREIHSHRQALRQCRDFLTHYCWGIPLIETDDTAHAAQLLANGELPKKSAVIAHQTCAELYGLTALQKDIQDLKNNLTLFLAVTKHETIENT